MWRARLSRVINAAAAGAKKKTKKKKVVGGGGSPAAAAADLYKDEAHNGAGNAGDDLEESSGTGGIATAEDVSEFMEKQQLKIIERMETDFAKLRGTLEVTPFDPSLLNDIEKAIAESPLDLSPTRKDNHVIVRVPSLDVEQLKSMRKLAGDASESAKITFRNVRRQALEGIKAALLPQDDSRRLEKLVQKMVDQGCKAVEDKLALKKQELS